MSGWLTGWVSAYLIPDPYLFPTPQFLSSLSSLHHSGASRSTCSRPLVYFVSTMMLLLSCAIINDTGLFPSSTNSSILHHQPDFPTSMHSHQWPVFNPGSSQQITLLSSLQSGFDPGLSFQISLTVLSALLFHSDLNKLAGVILTLFCAALGPRAL